MVKNGKSGISWKQNITFPRNKKILNLCCRLHSLRIYCFVAKVAFRWTGSAGVYKGCSPFWYSFSLYALPEVVQAASFKKSCWIEGSDFLLGQLEGPNFVEEQVGSWKTFWVYLEIMSVTAILL